MHTLKVTRCETFSQCRALSHHELCVTVPPSNFRVPEITRAAALRTRCSLLVVDFDVGDYYYYYYYYYSNYIAEA